MSKKNKKVAVVETKVNEVAKSKEIAKKEHELCEAHQHLVVAQTRTRSVYVYKTMDDITLAPEARKTSNIYNGFADFCEKVGDEEINDFASNFNVDMMDVKDGRLRKSIVWAWLIKTAQDTKKDMSVPRSERVPKKEGKLTNRTYVLVSTDLPKDIKFPPQAIACLEIVKGLDRKEILEQDLKDEVEKKQDMLHTRQDPWRIFQYYRPQLIQHHLLRMV